MQDWQKKVLEMTEEETYNLINNLDKMNSFFDSIQNHKVFHGILIERKY